MAPGPAGRNGVRSDWPYRHGPGRSGAKAADRIKGQHFFAASDTIRWSSMAGLAARVGPGSRHRAAAAWWRPETMRVGGIRILAQGRDAVHRVPARRMRFRAAVAPDVDYGHALATSPGRCGCPGDSARDLLDAKEPAGPRAPGRRKGVTPGPGYGLFDARRGAATPSSSPHSGRSAPTAADRVPGRSGKTGKNATRKGAHVDDLLDAVAGQQL